MKRLLAALLTLSMLVGIVPFSAFAESPGAVPETFAAAQESPGLDDETVQSIVSDPLLQGQYAPPQQTQPTVDTSNMSMEATDSFGKLLVNSIDEQNSASSSENRVIGVTVDGSTATVEYVAAEDADIVVALSTATGNDHSFAASFSDLTPGVSYAVIVSRSEIDPLAPENLIYINQFRATSSGYQQSFQTPRSSALNADDMTYVIASGIYSFDEAPTPTPTPGGGSSSGGGGGGGGGAAVLIGVGAAAAITAGVIMMSPVEIKGRVVLTDQAAVPGAKISLLREGKVVAQTTADENGSFSLKAKRGSYELTAAYTTADGQLIYKTIDIKAPAKDLTVTF